MNLQKYSTVRSTNLAAFAVDLDFLSGFLCILNWSWYYIILKNTWHFLHWKLWKLFSRSILVLLFRLTICFGLVDTCFKTATVEFLFNSKTAFSEREFESYPTDKINVYLTKILPSKLWYPWKNYSVHRAVKARSFKEKGAKFAWKVKDLCVKSAAKRQNQKPTTSHKRNVAERSRFERRDKTIPF